MRIRFFIKKVAALVVAAVVVIFLFSCSQSQQEEGTAESRNEGGSKGVSEGINVTDYSGNSVGLEHAATRVIALAPHLIENMFSAGAGDLLVARVEHADYPPEVATLPSVGGYQSWSLEAISALQPDLILAWHSGISDRFAQQIHNLGIPLYLDEPTSLSDIAKSLKDIGRLTGRESTAEQAASNYLSELQKFENRSTQLSPVRVFYQVWDDPLYTINGEQMISDVIRVCGGKNIFANAPVKAPVVSMESLIERDPEAIFTGSKESGEERDVLEKVFASLLRWETVSAVKNKHLFVVNPDVVARHTVRLIEGVSAVCGALEEVRG